MSSKRRRVTVVGAGSWGTAIGSHLCRNGHEVALWARESEVLEEIRQSGCNSRYLPEEKLARGLGVESDLPRALSRAEILTIAIPSTGVRSLAQQIRGSLPVGVRIVSLTKGLEGGSLKTMSEIWAEEIGDSAAVTVLSGPSFAAEVVKGMPTAVVVAGSDPMVTEEIVDLFHSDYFRVYASSDVRGVELGGAAKNVIALATGMLEGVGLGMNARAALVTRGLAEIQRLVVAAGGEARTAAGLSGLGDLLLTCTGELSRNRRVGIQLGQGSDLQVVVAGLGQVAEGVETASKLVALSEKLSVETPIIREVALVLRGASTVRDSIGRLLARARAKE